MKALLFVLPALVCQAQQPELPILAAKALRLPEGDLLTLQARLAADPAPAAQKAYDELYLTYNLATRRTRSDPKAAAAMVEQALKALDGTRDPERMALQGAFLGLKINLSPMSAPVLSYRAMGLFDRAVAGAPGNPRPMILRAVHLLYMPGFMGGGAEAAIPLLEAAVAAAGREAQPADPWAPSWGRIESLSWLARAQVTAGRLEEARATAARALALDARNGFLETRVLPELAQGGR